ncbi:MAG: phospholipase D family protein [Chitinispirillales bacterium]|jgi:HKD family nuclease|nr:phospholipase D family protein [Chitinispirillales bacterium]
MKLITTSIDLEKEFRRLTNQYDNFYWATAWASSGSKLFNDLLSHKGKIQKIVVGIHFYQTHPDFIEAFLNDKKVRFIQQPEGTFHPKLYLFTNKSNEWEMIIGSANFTTQAFTRNTEASLLLSHSDSNSTDTYNHALKLVEQTFLDGRTFDKTDLDKYRITWSNHRQKIKSLSGQYGSKKRKPKPIYEVPMINRSWDEFINEIRNEAFHGLVKRLRVIEIAKNLFYRVDHFYELTEDERKFIAGIPNKLDIDGAEDWGYFGSMKGAGIFKNKIKANDKNISKALDQIPLTGQITKKHYDNYIKFFIQVFSGNYIATATRLLCMKRPDTFVCFDSKNRSALCKDFGIIQSEMDYGRYWDDIVERIYDSDWWLNPNPKNKEEEKVSEARAAFLDSLYYEERQQTI